MFRDFSDEAKQKLLKYVDEVTADHTKLARTAQHPELCQ